MTGPYATAADAYWSHGWRGILPLPAGQKKNPPRGFTGQGGLYPSYPDIATWVDGPERNGNIALRMPLHVIGLDVDAYGDKVGAQTLRLAESQHGELPPTWRTTSRDDGVSGIRLYRVPEGLAWPGEIGPGTEVIQAGHRYAIVWPSLHPEGRTYRWIGPDGIVSTVIPDPDVLPLLPEAWVEAYTGGATATVTHRKEVGHNEAVAWIASQGHATASMCARMERAIDQFADDLRGSAHNSTRDATLRIARLASEGHHGAVHALAAVRKAFITDATSAQRALLGKTQRTASEAAYEFGELVSSGVGVVLGNPTGVATCDCYGQLTGALLTKPASVEVSGPVVDGSVALDPLPTPVPAKVDDTEPVDDSGLRFRDGASFILDAPDSLPNVWGAGDDCLWAEGEALMICGPPGVGKTTLCGQVVRGLLGLQPSVLGLPVRPAERRVLYLAMDRPAQIRRGLRRTFRETDRQVLAEGLQVWEGPPPGDVARHPTVLLSLAQIADADVIVIDSIKDAAVGLTEDETAAAYNRARQTCLANDVQVLELHHMVKRGANGNKPTELADVYGSAWLTAGAGSVLLLWGAAGDPIVQMTHLKQPATEVGPWRLEHDHGAGVTTVFQGADLLTIVASGGHSGVTPTDVARVLFSTENPTDAEKVKARRKLNGLVDARLVERVEKARDVYAGGKAQTYFRALLDSPPGPVDDQRRSNDAASFQEVNDTNDAPTTSNTVSAGQPNEHPNDANDTAGPTTLAPSPYREGRVDPGPEPASKPPFPTSDCNGCGAEKPATVIEAFKGYCAPCAKERS